GLRDANGKRKNLVFVSTTWEPWTATVKSRLDSDNSDQFTRVARRELLSSYIPVKLDAGSAEGKRLCEQYKIKSFPMFLYLSARGGFIMKRAGYGEKFEFAERLILARQLLPLIAQSEQRLKRKPQDAPTLEVLAMTYAKRWMPD